MDLRLFSLLLGVLVSTVNESALTPALPFLARDLRVGSALAQGVVTAGLLGSALAYLPLTLVAGRVGAGRVYRTGLFLHGLAALLLYLAPSLPLLYGLRFLQGIAAAGVVGLVPGLVAAGYPDRRGYALGLVASTVAAGTLFGPALGGLLTGSWGWRFVFLLPLPFALLALSQSGHLPGLPPQGGDLGRLLRTRPFLLALLATGLYFAHTLGVSVALAFFLAEAGLGPEAVGGLLLLAPLELLLLGAWAGRLADRRGYARVVILGGWLLLLGGVGLALLAYRYPVPGAVVGLLLLGVGRALFQAANNAQVLSLAPPGEEALASGALSVARVLGQGLGGLLAGVGLHALAGLGPRGGFAALILLLSSLMGLSLLFLSRGVGKGRPAS
ncbi:MFS transporter [Thermus islandicus]|uniref:MFS transporter n=1 Tax=Thermus islandicus TaxID=540988 RepID=UPI0003B33A62|nr:MFS transporter [Thermus islandicus]